MLAEYGYGEDKLVIAISEKKDGSMGSSIPGRKKAERKNRRKFLKKIGVDSAPLARLHQVHGNKIIKVKSEFKFSKRKVGDGLVTNLRKTFLSILTADCVPVFFYDRSFGAIGIAHAGWKGVVKKISSKAVQSLIKDYKINPKDTKVILGPGIRKCHFSILTQDRHKSLISSRLKKFVFKSGEKFYFDLFEALKAELSEAGIRRENITDMKICTYCRTDLFSYRREVDKGKKSFSNMLNVIALK